LVLLPWRRAAVAQDETAKSVMAVRIFAARIVRALAPRRAAAWLPETSRWRPRARFEWRDAYGLDEVRRSSAAPRGSWIDSASRPT